MNTKQVIVMRKDLNMRKGKMCAQAAHASMKVFFDTLYQVSEDSGGFVPDGHTSRHDCIDLSDPDIRSWVFGSFAKICVGVNSEEELLDLYGKALEVGLPAALIQDSGKTEFGGVPTHTCIAIGPAASEKIDVITGHLVLL